MKLTLNRIYAYGPKDLCYKRMPCRCRVLFLRWFTVTLWSEGCWRIYTE